LKGTALQPSLGAVVGILLRLLRQAQCKQYLLSPTSRPFIRLALSDCVGGVARQVQCCSAGYQTFFLRLTVAEMGGHLWLTLSLALQFLCLVLSLV